MEETGKYRSRTGRTQPKAFEKFAKRDDQKLERKKDSRTEKISSRTSKTGPLEKEVRPERGTRPERSTRPDKSVRPDRNTRTDKAPYSEKSPRTEKGLRDTRSALLGSGLAQSDESLAIFDTITTQTTKLTPETLPAWAEQVSKAQKLILEDLHTRDVQKSDYQEVLRSVIESYQ